jgi:hypothetical protein
MYFLLLCWYLLWWMLDFADDEDDVLNGSDG